MFTVKVIPDNENEEPFTVTSGSRDVLEWERTTRGRTFSKLADDLQMTDIYRLTFIAARRQGLYSGKERDFEADHELEVIGEEHVDPTPPGRSPGD